MPLIPAEMEVNDKSLPYLLQCSNNFAQVGAIYDAVAVFGVLVITIN